MFVSDLVGNPEDRFSQNEAHMCVSTLVRLIGKHLSDVWKIATVNEPRCEKTGLRGVPTRSHTNRAVPATEDG